MEGLVGLALSRFAVSSDVSAAIEARQITADARLHVLITRKAASLSLKLRVRPLAEGALIHPGEGTRHVLGQVIVDGAVEHVQAERDLELAGTETSEVLKVDELLALLRDDTSP